jgi:hypothetical protein
MHAVASGLLALADIAEKEIYIQASDNPIGQLFLLIVFVAFPILTAVGVYSLFEKNWGGAPSKWIAVGAVIFWWVLCCDPLFEGADMRFFRRCAG